MPIQLALLGGSVSTQTLLSNIAPAPDAIIGFGFSRFKSISILMAMLSSRSTTNMRLDVP